MITKIEVPFSELEINKNEALRYAGIKGEADTEILKLYDVAYNLLSEKATSKAVYKCEKVTYFDGGVSLGKEKIVSSGLHKFLQGAENAAILAATAGIEADRLINRYSMVEPSLALMIDAMAAAGVEALCNSLCCNCFCVEKSRRFSPGYGDFPMEYQKRIIEILNTPLNIGVTLTNSLMLTPTKSVTSVAPLKGCNKNEH